MSGQHAPGPWHFVEASEGNKPRFWVVQNPDTWIERVCAVPDYDGHSEANARLIAAAPELLAALEAVLAGLGVTEAYDGNKRIWRSAFDAVAKARGDA